MKTVKRSGKQAFTLIELMAVVTIIIILAGLVVGGLGFVNERQAKEKARVQIALLSKAIEEYKLDMGVYPGSTVAYGGVLATSANDTNATKALYNALFMEGYTYTSANSTTDPGTRASKIYLADLDPRTSKQGWVTTTTNTTPTIGLTILDPWGQPYRYRVGTAAMNPDFDLWSIGKDGLTRTGTAAADMSHASVRDDIRNF